MTGATEKMRVGLRALGEINAWRPAEAGDVERLREWVVLELGVKYADAPDDELARLVVMGEVVVLALAYAARAKQKMPPGRSGTATQASAAVA